MLNIIAFSQFYTNLSKPIGFFSTSFLKYKSPVENIINILKV